MTRLRIVVLDGLDWSWCCAHRDATEPLWRMAEVGCCGRLESTHPPVTSSAVAALLAGRHIRVPWVNGDRYSTSQEIIRTSPWLFELRKHELSIGLCNVPLTWPAFALPRGSWMTSGYPVPSKHVPGRRWFWPEQLDINDRIYDIDGVIGDSLGGPGGTRDLERLNQCEDCLASWLVARPTRSTVEIIWLRLTDVAGHHAWNTDDYGLAVARAAGRAAFLGTDTRNVIVISDHGFDAVDSERCAEYMATEHGPTTREANLLGGHTMDGVLFACGEDIHARGELAGMQLVHVASGVFDLLQIPPPPGMEHGLVTWSRSIGVDEEAKIRKQLHGLGYL